MVDAEEDAPAAQTESDTTREERFQATEPNQAWSIDFVADQLQDGRRFRALTIVDVFTREGVAIEVGQSLKGQVRGLVSLHWNVMWFAVG